MIFVFGYKIFGAKVQFFLGDKGVKELKGVKGGIFCKLFTNFAKKWETSRQGVQGVQDDTQRAEL